MDRIDYVLAPEDGLLGVVDFYTSGRQPSLHEKAIGGGGKECGWLSRWFWQIWFDFDHVSLSPHRRDYLEYKFGTVSVPHEHSNRKLKLPLLRSKATTDVIDLFSRSSSGCRSAFWATTLPYSF